MLTAVIACASALILFTGIGYWIYNNLDVLLYYWDFAKEFVMTLSDVFPSWLAPLLGVGLGLAILSLMVKLL